MTFQPQRIICPLCLHSSLIITEDIRDDNRENRIWVTGLMIENMMNVAVFIPIGALLGFMVNGHKMVHG